MALKEAASLGDRIISRVLLSLDKPARGFGCNGAGEEGSRGGRGSGYSLQCRV